ncbi:hypothetical protein B0T21DRAFT_406641 [Apiosordaria backusii]|uniref:Uncharacterized protein n=1 Tax=Apiosordaria backusii TaxID=314023 RepID=A0AA40EYX4_9PEZI|nr:hypothetical protein B0T21DRAFT_406641 [Apiosordaria backusii]
MAVEFLPEEEIEGVLRALKSFVYNDDYYPAAAAAAATDDNNESHPSLSGTNPECNHPHSHHDDSTECDMTTCSCPAKPSTLPLSTPSPPPPSKFYPDPLPQPTIILRHHTNFHPWLQTLLSTASALSLNPLFSDLGKLFHPSLDPVKRLSHHNSPFYIKGAHDRKFFFILSRPNPPVIWDCFPALFSHRLTIEEQKSVIDRIIRDPWAVRWEEGWGWGYRIVWGLPSRERERVLGTERLTRRERERWEGVKREYEGELREYERQVWGVGRMWAWLGRSIDRELLRRGGRRRDDDVGEWGEAGGLRKLVLGCMRVLLDERVEEGRRRVQKGKGKEEGV